MDQQRHAGFGFVKRSTVSDHAMLVKQFTVIAGHDDDGVVELVRFCERIVEQPHLRIDVMKCVVVAVLHAFELRTGKRLWRQSYPAPYTVNPAAFSHGPGPKATPETVESS